MLRVLIILAVTLIVLETLACGPEASPTATTPNRGNPTTEASPTATTPNRGNPTTEASPTATTPNRGNPTAVALVTDSTPTYIWIPKYADPFMADKMVNYYLPTLVTLCTGIFGGVWSVSEPNYWEIFDICAVNAQLGFPDPTGVATRGCVLESSGCRKYQLKR